MDNQTTPAGVAIESTPLLAPCPFCGNKPKLLVRATGYNELRFIVSCPGPCSMKIVSTGPYTDQDNCVAAWNDRANAPRQGRSETTYPERGCSAVWACPWCGCDETWFDRTISYLPDGTEDGMKTRCVKCGRANDDLPNSALCVKTHSQETP